MTSGRGSVRDALIALSLANLHFLALWSGLLAARNLMFRSTVVVDAAAITVCVIGLGVLLFVSIRFARRLRRRIKGLEHLFLLTVLVPIDWARTQVPLATRAFWLERVAGGGNAVWAILMLTLGACAVVVYLRNPPRVRRALQQSALILLPLLPICLVQALYYEHRLEAPPTAHAFSQSAGQPRVVWLLFDEMDFPLAFTRRPVGFALPNLDRLRGESLSATAARSPATETQLSVPSLLAGRHVSAFVPVSASEALISYTSSTDRQPRPASNTARWGSTETVFDWIRALRLNAGLAGTGTSLPYCRVFSDRLTRCDNTGAPRPLGGMVLVTLLSHPVLARYVFSPQTVETRTAIVRRPMVVANHLKAVEVTQRLAADPSLAFVFAHFLLPHPPYVAGKPPSYYGNLMLSDSLFGAIRQSMEQSGTWNTTSVIVTSDHGLRGALFGPSESPQQESDVLEMPRPPVARANATHVPFFVKLGGQSDHLSYDRPFDTVLLAELTLKLLRRELATAKEVATWLDAREAGTVEGHSLRSAATGPTAVASLKSPRRRWSALDDD